MNLKDFGTEYSFDPQSDYLGGGAYGDVYQATDRLGRRVALKFYSRSQSQKYSLEKEIKRAVAFNNPNICRYITYFVLDSVNEVGQPVKTEVGVMELAEEGRIDKYLRSHPQYRRKLLVDILRGLGYLHSKQVIHRDLKPANVLISVEDGVPVAKIADFGVSRSSAVTSGGVSVMGTFDYMAPEQVFPRQYGVADVIPTNSDLWSFGVMTYELLTGSPPFGGDGPQVSGGQVLEDIVSGIPEEVFAQIPEPYQSLLRRCMVLQFSERAQSAEELIPLLDRPEADRVPPRISVRWDREASSKGGASGPQRPVTLPGERETRSFVDIRKDTLPEELKEDPKPEETADIKVPLSLLTEPQHSGGLRTAIWVAGGLIVSVALALGVWSRTHPKKDSPPPPPPVATLAVNCNRECGWTVDGKPSSDLPTGKDGRREVTPGQPLVIEAKAINAKLSPQTKTITLAAGEYRDVSINFPQTPPPPPCSHEEIDAFLQTGYDDELKDDLSAAYSAYSKAESLSTSCDRYRFSDASKGKQNVLASCRDRGIACTGR